MGTGAQHPLLQKKPLGQGEPHGAPHCCAPAGQTWHPHSGGRSLPTQISHSAQVFVHDGTCVQGLHLVGSVSVVGVHEPLPFALSEPR